MQPYSLVSPNPVSRIRWKSLSCTLICTYAMSFLFAVALLAYATLRACAAEGKRSFGSKTRRSSFTGSLRLPSSLRASLGPRNSLKHPEAISMYAAAVSACPISMESPTKSVGPLRLRWAPLPHGMTRTLIRIAVCRKRRTGLLRSLKSL